MNKLKMHSPNLTEDNIARLRELFPGCVTEAKGEDGSVKLAVDFDQLRQELSGTIVEGPQERYHLNWPGKREALLTANAPIAKTLRPVRSESVDFDTTKNLFIEGDNLDALKLLQETYLGKDMTDDGVTLSGGEMQKLMMARALYKNCRLLLLDEPTAALDAISENEMYETYSTLLKNKTALFISHRLASTRFCDTILFLENGKIKERGTHDELLALGGSYAHMFEVQSQYYQETEEHI